MVAPFDRRWDMRPGKGCKLTRAEADDPLKEFALLPFTLIAMLWSLMLILSRGREVRSSFVLNPWKAFTAS
tara:strand:- start:17 stop:229 length:213 start_codon:yes stop_codon:yes gene_type:complete